MFRDIKTRLKIAWLVISNQYDRSLTRDGITGKLTAVMNLCTKQGDVSIKININRVDNNE